ncbi:MAG: APC family permease [Candidatus Nezhaarchaeota archaeon]|nr:APC family permease [Candidatus Nezhaarchaeota archaeon]
MAEGELKRSLGFWTTWAMCLGLVTCSTTLMTLSLGFGDIGAGFTVTHILALAYIIIVCLAFSELATMYPRASSLELYTSKALGRAAGISMGLWYGFKDIFGFPAESALAGIILEHFFPQVPWWGWAVLVLSVFMAANLFGIVVAGYAQLMLLIIMVGSYLAMAVIGFVVGAPNWAYLGQTFLSPPASELYPGAPPGLTSAVVLMLMGVWLFIGMEVAGPLAEEVKNPARTIPLAMISSMVTLFSVEQFLGLSWAATVPREVLLTHPYHVGAAEYLLGPAGGAWFALISLFATGTTINSVMAGATRVLYGMSKEGYLPRVFGWIHPRFRTPWGSLFILYVLMIIVIGSAATVLGIEAPFTLALSCSFVFTIVYLFMFFNVIALRIKRPQDPRPFKMGGPFKVPALAVIGIIVTFVILVYTVMPPYGNVDILTYGGIYCLVLFLIGLAIYYAKARKMPEPA